MKGVCSLLKILSILVFTISGAKAALSDLSHGIQKKQVKINKAPQIKRKPKTKKYKVYASNNDKPPLKTAVLWHAPPYKKMATKLSSKEEVLRDMQALEILIEGAELNYSQIKKARKILQKNNSPLASIAKGIFSQINQMTVNLDLTNYKKIRTEEQAQELIEEVNKYLISNYHIYKANFFINDMRNQKFKNKIQTSRDNLAMISGEERIDQVDRLFIGDQYVL
jgi:viroplasmin and RNaseH domain-containing protein